MMTAKQIITFPNMAMRPSRPNTKMTGRPGASIDSEVEFSVKLDMAHVTKKNNASASDEELFYILYYIIRRADKTG